MDCEVGRSCDGLPLVGVDGLPSKAMAEAVLCHHIVPFLGSLHGNLVFYRMPSWPQGNTSPRARKSKNGGLIGGFMATVTVTAETDTLALQVTSFSCYDTHE
jgi:hypothetical protein